MFGFIKKRYMIAVQGRELDPNKMKFFPLPDGDQLDVIRLATYLISYSKK